jgi:hypothetical protein
MFAIGPASTCRTEDKRKRRIVTDSERSHRMHQKSLRAAKAKLAFKLLQVVIIPMCIWLGQFPTWFDVWLVFVAIYIGVTGVRAYRHEAAQGKGI